MVEWLGEQVLPLARQGGVTVAIENCPAVGNIATSPAMWRALFDQALPELAPRLAPHAESSAMRIEGKTFITTGGASGLGEGTARMLTAEGGKVVIADMQVDKGEAVAKEIGSAFVKCDVSSEVDGQAAVAQATSMGKLMGLVNCAGIAPAERTVGKAGPHKLDVYTKTIMVNLVGSFNMIRLAADAMCQNEPESTGERGVLISTASVAAYDGQIGQRHLAGVAGVAVDLVDDGLRHRALQQRGRAARGDALQHVGQLGVLQHVTDGPGLAGGVVEIARGHRVLG